MEGIKSTIILRIWESGNWVCGDWCPNKWLSGGIGGSTSDRAAGCNEAHVIGQSRSVEKPNISQDEREEFQDLFVSMIHENETFAKSQKMQLMPSKKRRSSISQLTLSSFRLSVDNEIDWRSSQPRIRRGTRSLADAVSFLSTPRRQRRTGRAWFARKLTLYQRAFLELPSWRWC